MEILVTPLKRPDRLRLGSCPTICKAFASKARCLTDAHLLWMSQFVKSYEEHVLRFFESLRDRIHFKH